MEINLIFPTLIIQVILSPFSDFKNKAQLGCYLLSVTVGAGFELIVVVTVSQQQVHARTTCEVLGVYLL